MVRLSTLKSKFPCCSCAHKMCVWSHNTFKANTPHFWSAAATLKFSESSQGPLSPCASVAYLQLILHEPADLCRYARRHLNLLTGRLRCSGTTAPSCVSSSVVGKALRLSAFVRPSSATHAASCGVSAAAKGPLGHPRPPRQANRAHYKAALHMGWAASPVWVAAVVAGAKWIPACTARASACTA